MTNNVIANILRGQLFGSQQVAKGHHFIKTLVLFLEHLPKLHLTHKSLKNFDGSAQLGSYIKIFKIFSLKNNFTSKHTGGIV